MIANFVWKVELCNCTIWGITLVQSVWFSGERPLNCFNQNIGSWNIGPSKICFEYWSRSWHICKCSKSKFRKIFSARCWRPGLFKIFNMFFMSQCIYMRSRSEKATSVQHENCGRSNFQRTSARLLFSPFTPSTKYFAPQPTPPQNSNEGPDFMCKQWTIEKGQCAVNLLGNNTYIIIQLCCSWEIYKRISTHPFY